MHPATVGDDDWRPPGRRKHRTEAASWSVLSISAGARCCWPLVIDQVGSAGQRFSRRRAARLIFAYLLCWAACFTCRPARRKGSTLGAVDRNSSAVSAGAWASRRACQRALVVLRSLTQRGFPRFACRPRQLAAEPLRSRCRRRLYKCRASHCCSACSSFNKARASMCSAGSWPQRPPRRFSRRRIALVRLIHSAAARRDSRRKKDHHPVASRLVGNVRILHRAAGRSKSAGNRLAALTTTRLLAGVSLEP